MEYKRLFTLIVPVLMALIVPVIIYSYNLYSVAFDEHFYKNEFLKYNVYENLKNYDVDSINNGVLTYLRSRENNNLIENNFFNEREKTHLLDVKNLIQLLFSTFSISLILFLLLLILFILFSNSNFRIIGKRVLIILLFGSLLTLLDAALLFILSNLNFEFAFDVFHKTFFSLGTYTFDPSYENIVVLYPQNLFFDALARITFGAIIMSIKILFFCAAFLLIFLKPNSIFFEKKYRRKK